MRPDDRHALRRRLLQAAGAAWAVRVIPAAAVTPRRIAAPAFPRLMALDYRAGETLKPAVREHLARFDAVVLGFWRGFGAQRVRASVADLRQRNADIVLGQYTVLNEVQGEAREDEANHDLVQKIEREGWWLRDRRGQRVQWTQQFRNYEVNLTAAGRPDDDGLRWPEWKARRDVREVFSLWQSEPDFVFLDNVMVQPRVDAVYDEARGEERGGAPSVAARARQGYADYVQELHRLMPGLPVMANIDGDLSAREFAGVFGGAFMEGLIGRPWSLENTRGWRAAFEHYRAVSAQVRGPLVVLQAAGEADDYRQMRFGLATALMGDGYYAYGGAEGAGPPWFDEFDVALGAALGPAQPVGGSGAWLRRFARGVAVVNGGPSPAQVQVPSGLARLRGRQDAAHNDGRPVDDDLLLRPRDGIVLVAADADPRVGAAR